MDVKSYVCLAAVLVMSAVLFCLMGIDKRLAVTHRRRVSEKTLFSFAALFGAPGGLLGMYVFHHKTKHWYFVVGMPAILILQMCIAVLIWKTHGFGM